ncbi:MAG: DUF2400 domain-containing protein, partial [Muribaculaceae bacterium]|nr:DUF2400 domain-containing protein [Muribaculaceae bacterium]
MKGEIITRVSAEIKDLLDSEAKRINSVSFIESDPVQFPRRFSSLQDIEIAGLLSAIIAWGNRKMICRDAERMLTLMDNEPYHYVMEEGYEDLNPDMNLHRTFFGRHFQYFLRGMHRIYKDYGSLDAFSKSVGAGESETPSWKLVGEMQKIITDANGETVSKRGLPNNL